MQGTSYPELHRPVRWVAAGEDGLFGVVVTERDEPQAVIGSNLHRSPSPTTSRSTPSSGGLLKHAHEHPGKRHRRAAVRSRSRSPRCSSVQNRGEYLYAACGEGGVRVFDIAFIDHKAFSERITTAPVSPLGQRFYVPTEVRHGRRRPDDDGPRPDADARARRTSEQPIHPLYGYIYVADKYEGLILVGVGTTARRQPAEQLPQARGDVQPGRHPARGARTITIVGHLRLRLLRRRPGGRVDSTTRRTRRSRR